MEKSIEVLVANESHKCYIPDILAAIYEASKVKGANPAIASGCSIAPRNNK